jgi:hypothetical protein
MIQMSCAITKERWTCLVPPRHCEHGSHTGWHRTGRWKGSGAAGACSPQALPQHARRPPHPGPAAQYAPASVWTRLQRRLWSPVGDAAQCPPSFPNGPSQGPRPRSTPEALTDPILRGMSRPRYAALCRAARRCSRQPRRAGGAASTASQQWPPVEAGGGSGRAKKWLCISCV